MKLSINIDMRKMSLMNDPYIAVDRDLKINYTIEALKEIIDIEAVVLDKLNKSVSKKFRVKTLQEGLKSLEKLIKDSVVEREKFSIKMKKEFENAEKGNK